MEGEVMEKKKIDLTEIMGRFGNEEAARELIERLRWPNGPVCPRCGCREIYRLTPNGNFGNHGRKGLLKCKVCRKQFTVTVGTIFEDSHIPLHKWLMAIYLICSSKKGMSAFQLHRMLGITYKSAWFMGHRIRFAMTQSPLSKKLSSIVEADETYVGGKAHGKRGRGAENKTKVFSLIQRDGDTKSFVVDNVRGKTLKKLIKDNVIETAHVMTDEFKAYNGLKKQVAKHSTVEHGKKEYVRGIVHVNFAESYFSLLKRGILGTFHHVSKEHMPRYLSEFDFRWNRRDKDDGESTIEAIQNSKGKRLMYRDSSSFAGTS
ncbi:MAG: IS1595 family transposase [Thermodesulfobacteriota bacterium]|jgi:transposase-like protein